MIGEILKNSWKITWKNKILWVFGLLIIIFGQINESALFLTNFELISEQTNKIIYFKKILDSEKILIFIKNLKILLISRPFQIFLFILIFLIAVFIAIFIHLISQGVIIYLFKEASQGKKLNIIKGLSAGIRKFWSLFNVYILSNLLLFALFSISVLPFIIYFLKSNQPQWFLASFFFYLLIFIPVNYLIYFISRFVYCFLILKNKNIFSSIKEAVLLFFKNWFIILKIALVLGFIYFFTGFLAVIISFLINLPLLFLSLFLRYFALFNISWLVLILNSVIIIVLNLILFSILTILQYNTLIYLFNKLTNPSLKK